MERKFGAKGFVYLVQIIFVIIAFSAIFFLAAGRVNITRAWIYSGITLFLFSISAILTYVKNPELIKERAKRKEDSKKWDKILLRVFAITFVSPLVLAGLDIRYEWSALGTAWMIPGIIFLTLSSVLSTWAMIINRHYERNVRIQSDRDHQVVSTGPYRFIRHPGYASTILWVFSIPMIIGSSVAFMGAGACLVVLIIRTALEDRTLRDELDGYADYAAKVRFRLIPGIW